MSLSVRVGAPHVLSELPKTCRLSEALQIATLKPAMMAHMRKGQDTGVKQPEVDHTEYTRAQLEGEIEELETEIANWNRKKGEAYQEKKKLLAAYKKALKKKEKDAAEGLLGKIKAGVRKDMGKKARNKNKALREQRRDWKLNRTTAGGAKDNTDRWLIEQNRLREKYGYPALAENDLELEGREDRGELSSDDSDDEEDRFQEQRKAAGEAGPSGTSPPDGGQQLDPVAVMDDDEFDFDDDVFGPGGEEQAIPAQASVEGDVFLAGSEEIDTDDAEAAAALAAALESDSDYDSDDPFGSE